MRKSRSLRIIVVHEKLTVKETNCLYIYNIRLHYYYLFQKFNIIHYFSHVFTELSYSLNWVHLHTLNFFYDYHWWFKLLLLILLLHLKLTWNVKLFVHFWHSTHEFHNELLQAAVLVAAGAVNNYSRSCHIFDWFW